MVTKHTMRDFIGLEKADAEARKAMMNFSYLSTIGNMDEAFKAIKLIKRYATEQGFYETEEYAKLSLIKTVRNISDTEQSGRRLSCLKYNDDLED